MSQQPCIDAHYAVPHQLVPLLCCVVVLHTHSKDGQFDQRLFNQASGMDAGFKNDDCEGRSVSDSLSRSFASLTPSLISRVRCLSCRPSLPGCLFFYGLLETLLP